MHPSLRTSVQVAMACVPCPYHITYPVLRASLHCRDCVSTSYFECPNLNPHQTTAYNRNRNRNRNRNLDKMFFGRRR